MENAASALKMGAAILIFIIAIASSFSLFGTAKQTADSIITMRDKQKYLEAAELDNGILYTSSSSIEGTTGLTEEQIEGQFGVTTSGDRVVQADDVVATIYRYSKEKYGVTIVKSDGTVIARFDTGTDSFMAQYKNYKEDEVEQYIEMLNSNTENSYITNNMYKCNKANIKVDNTLYTIYGNTQTSVFGDEIAIQKRINAELSGSEGLLDKLTASNKIVEVTNEIDNSKYLKETDENGNVINSNLLQQYQMPTIEIIYIIY